MLFKRNVTLLYIIIFFHNLIPAYVIERLFWQERGMTLQMVVYTEIIYAATIVLLEIPSGALADRFSRKGLILIGSVMAAMEFILLLYAHHFWQFALVVILTGIGGACTSGAWNALLYDSLAAMGRESSFERVLGRIYAVDSLAAIIAALSGSVTARYFGLEINYVISLASALLALIATCLLREPPRAYAGDGPRMSLLRIIKQAAAFFRRSPHVLMVILHATVFAAMITYVDEFWQLYLLEIDYPLALYGLVTLLMTAGRIPGAIISSWLIACIKTALLLPMITFTVALSLVLTALIGGIAGIILMSLACCLTAVLEMVMMGYIHHRADGGARATIESVASLLERACSVGLGLLFGWIASAMSLYAGYMMLGLAGALITTGCALLYRRKVAL